MRTWRRYGWVCLLVLAINLPQARASDGGGDDEYVTGEVLVKLNNSADLGAVATAYHLDPQPLDQFGTRSIYRLRIIDSQRPSDRATELAKDGRVAYAEPNYVGSTPEDSGKLSWATGEPGSYSGQWAPDKIGLQRAQGVSRGVGVRVAVLDTGVDRTHPALQGHLAPGYDFVDADADPSEVGSQAQNFVYGHGTHVAGLVALVAPEATIMPIRVLDSNGQGNLWVLSEALRYAADPDGNPATDDGADVINLSLSVSRRTRMLEEIVGEVCGGDATGGRGVVIVAAAGNDASSTPEYPAGEGIRGLLAVGATTPDDSLAQFSNRGSWVGVAAPGEDIVSTVPGGGYGSWSGTSMAAPFVAGAAALVRAADPALDARAVTDQIERSAARLNGDVQRRLDVAAAVNAPSDTPTPTAAPTAVSTASSTLTPSPTGASTASPTMSPAPSTSAQGFFVHLPVVMR